MEGHDHRQSSETQRVVEETGVGDPLEDREPERDVQPPPPPGEGEETTESPESTREATTAPGSGDLDEQAMEQGKDRLEQAGGGH
jgi:hypothetical protein